MKEPFTYCIPLRAKATATDWSKVVRLLDAALASALNQSDSDNIAVVIAGTDRPSTSFDADYRVSFVEVSGPPTPRTHHQQMIDKGAKKRASLFAAGKRGAGLVMLLDADDLVHTGLVMVARQTRGNGLIFKRGLEYDYQRKTARRVRNFDRLCGSCAVFRFRAEDFPQSPDDASGYADSFRDHSTWEEQAIAAGRPLTTCPIDGALYVVNTGENQSMKMSNVSWRRRLLRALLPGTRMTEKARLSFLGLPALARPAQSS